MLEMPAVQNIRSLFHAGHHVAEISRTLKISEPTVRKYANMENFNQQIPGTAVRPSKLDPFKARINQYLEEDSRTWYKQRHTARRIFERLTEEEGYTGSYSVVQRFIRQKSAASAKEAFLDQVWAPAEAQCDFGEADSDIMGLRKRMHYLVLTFPYSNTGFAQLFYGENAECVCEGLKRIFEFIGGVPRRIVFDNAAGVGQRVCDAVRLTEVFSRFQLHYRFAVTFCNPNSGHEKGSVENKVGTIRRSLFVPVPKIHDLEEYNATLLRQCVKQADTTHYRKGKSCPILFTEDCLAMAALPRTSFQAVRYAAYKTDKQAKVVVDGRFRYSTAPELAGRSVTVGFSAYEVLIYDSSGTLIAKHPRLYGNAPAESIDPSSSLRLLIARPGGWVNSRLRHALPDDLRNYIDSGERADIKSCLAALAEATEVSDWPCAVQAARSVWRATGHLACADVTLYARRLFGGDGVVYNEPVDLLAYDRVFTTYLRKHFPKLSTCHSSINIP